MYGFDKKVDRRNSGSIKYDLVERKYGSKDVIPLWLADMDFVAPEFLMEAMMDRTRHGIFGYTKRDSFFGGNVANWLKRRHGWEIEEGWVEYAPSVLCSIVNLINEFTEEGDEIIIQPPVYHQFSGMINRNSRMVLENELIRENLEYHIDFEDLETKAKRESCKMMIFCSPHNPIGRVWKKDEIERVAEICFNNDVLMVSDEIHFDLVFGNNRHVPAAGIKEKYRDNIITCTSQSKTFNLAGLHSSYCILSDEKKRVRFAKRLGRLEVEASNVFGLLAANTVYEHGDEWLVELKDYLLGNMEFVVSFLEENIPKIRTRVNEGTYLMWLDCSGLGLGRKELDGFFARKACLGLSSGYTFGSCGEGFMRMNIACSRDRLAEAMERLKKAYNKYYEK